jgi:hypothetical protein
MGVEYFIHHGTPPQFSFSFALAFDSYLPRSACLDSLLLLLLLRT